MSARFLIIALDGADARRLEQWSDDGTLPNLAALRRSGRTLRLDAPPGTTDDSLWASFQYGQSEGEHGRYNYLLPLSTGRLGMAFTEEGDRDAFWHRLSAKGVRSAILDVPKSPAPKPFDGIHLADWLVHGRYFHEPRSFPSSLAADIVARSGPAPPSDCDYHQHAPDDARIVEMVGHLRASIAQKRTAALHYLEAERWDLFVVGFKEAHCAGHGLWNLTDPRHPEFDETRSARLGWPVRQIFADLDAAVGALVEAAGPDAATVVFSTSAMEPNGTLFHLLPGIVERLNALPPDSSGNRLSILERLFRRADRLQSTILPHADNCGALRITGTRSGGEKARYLTRIADVLAGLEDESTGRSVVARITYPSAEQIGARASALPDLLIHYASGLVPQAVSSPDLGRIEGTCERRRPGNHAMGGLAIVGGRAAEEANGLGAMQHFAGLVERVLGTPM